MIRAWILTSRPCTISSHCVEYLQFEPHKIGIINCRADDRESAWLNQLYRAVVISERINVVSGGGFVKTVLLTDRPRRAKQNKPYGTDERDQFRQVDLGVAHRDRSCCSARARSAASSSSCSRSSCALYRASSSRCWASTLCC